MSHIVTNLDNVLVGGFTLSSVGKAVKMVSDKAKTITDTAKVLVDESSSKIDKSTLHSLVSEAKKIADSTVAHAGKLISDTIAQQFISVMQTVKLPSTMPIAVDLSHLITFILKARVEGRIGDTINVVTKVGNKYTVNTESELMQIILKILSKHLRVAKDKTPAQIFTMFNRDKIAITIGELIYDIIHMFCPHMDTEIAEPMVGNLNIKFTSVLIFVLYGMFTLTMTKIDISHTDAGSIGFMCFVNIILFILQVVPLLLFLMKMRDETSLLHAVQTILSEPSIGSHLTLISPSVANILLFLKRDGGVMHGGGFSLCNVMKSLDIAKINSTYVLSLFRDISDVSGTEQTAKYIRATHYAYVMYLKNMDSNITNLNMGNITIISPLAIKNMLNTIVGLPVTFV